MEHLLKAKDLQLGATHNKVEALQAELQAVHMRAEAHQAELAMRCVYVCVRVCACV